MLPAHFMCIGKVHRLLRFPVNCKAAAELEGNERKKPLTFRMNDAIVK